MSRFLIVAITVMSLGIFFRAYAQEKSIDKVIQSLRQDKIPLKTWRNKSRAYVQGDSIDMIKILNIKQDIISLETVIAKQIKKQPKIADIQGLRQFHILFLGVDTDFNIEKSSYLDYSFLSHLHGVYYGKKEKFLDTKTLITDSSGNLVATTIQYVYVQQTQSPDSYMAKIAKMLFDGEIDCAFMLGIPHTGQYLVGAKGPDLYGIDDSPQNFKVYPWNEFIESHFDKWVRK